MRIFFFILIIFNITAAAQVAEKNNYDLFSQSNVKRFADYLFCQRDYLRAIDEYKRFLSSGKSDTVEFKIAFAYSSMGYNPDAADKFSLIPKDSPFYNLAQLEYLKSLFMENDFENYRDRFSKMNLNDDFIYYRNANSLFDFSFLFAGENLPWKKKFLEAFDNDKSQLEKFYDWKTDPPYKSPVKAAIFSALIPGAGKIYTENYADGIVAFLTTGILSYIAYTDFRADHKFRGWLFTALAAGFYGGNIYGSAASAQIFNAKIKFDFTEDLKNYLTKVNYFIPKIEFCK